LIAIGAGTGLVLILRWYWWRINAWSEISAMVASFVVSLIAMRVIPPLFPKPADPRIAEDPRVASTVLLVTVAVSTIAWVVTTLATKPESDAVLDSFYQRVRPGGPGWAAVSARLGYGREPIPGGALAWTNWLAGVVAVYTSLFGIGKIVFGDLGSGLAMLAVAAASFAWIARSFRSEGSGPQPAAAPSGAAPEPGRAYAGD
jgi:Na+/proline symporter